VVLVFRPSQRQRPRMLRPGLPQAAR